MVKVYVGGNLRIHYRIPVIKDFVLDWARVYVEDKCPENQ